MSLADFYRHISEFEEMLGERRSANLAKAAQDSTVAATLQSQERSNQNASGARARQLLAKAGRFDEYGEPIVFIDGYSTNMTLSQYAQHLEDKAYGRRKTAENQALRRRNRRIS